MLPFEVLSPSLLPHTGTDGRPVGKPLPDFRPCAPLPQAPMIGRHTRLERFEGAHHATPLWTAFREDDGSMWTYMPNAPYVSPEALAEDIVRRRDTQGFQTFVIHNETGHPSGMASFMRHDLANGCVEIGFIAFAPRLKQSRAATEALTLMMKCAFDNGYRRFEWKCDQLNRASNLAALRLGFTFEGVFRNAVVTKGRRRDTAWYAIILEDWPAVKVRLDAWLDPANFDQAGRQIKALSSL